MCVCVRERARESVCVCVCETESERKSVCVCVLGAVGSLCPAPGSARAAADLQSLR